MNIRNRRHCRTPVARMLVGLLLAALPNLAAPPPAGAQATLWKDGVGFDQKLNGELPLDAEFRDERGRTVRLGDYFGDMPVIITPVYYRCPMLCGLELNGLLRCLRAMELSAGKDFEIVTFSIDPREEADLAYNKRRHFLARYDREGSDAGWHFLTGEQPSIDRLCEAIGFRTKYNEQSGQYAHAAGIVVCTPGGRVSRYFYGVEFVPRDVRLGLVESSRGEIGSVADQVLLYCYLYDPTRGKYGLAILNLVRTGGVLTVVVLAGGICWMLRNERREGGGGRNADSRPAADFAKANGSHHG